MQACRLLLSVLSLASPLVSTLEAGTVLVLVRHAEKVDDSRDPDLSEEGKARAGALAAILKDAGIEKIYSTDFIRTRETARPAAERISTPVEIYDGDDLEGLARSLRAGSKRALVVGHSDTTPELVRLLGGDEGPPIADDEYDRIYLLVVAPGGEVATTILRFEP